MAALSLELLVLGPGTIMSAVFRSFDHIKFGKLSWFAE
jgi:hypothetical protein